MKRLQWKTKKSRKQFIQKSAFSVLSTWNEAKGFLGHNNISIDLDGIMDMHIESYAYNWDWVSKETWKTLQKEVMKDVNSFTRDDKWQDLNDYCNEWFEENK